MGRHHDQCGGLRKMLEVLGVTVEGIDGGKLRCTGASWTDAVLARRGPVFCEPERPAHENWVYNLVSEFTA
jgi:hypothetical protein